MKTEKKEAIQSAIDLLSEMIERANNAETFTVNQGDFLYHTIGETRDKLRESMTKKKPY